MLQAIGAVRHLIEMGKARSPFNACLAPICPVLCTANCGIAGIITQLPNAGSGFSGKCEILYKNLASTQSAPVRNSVIPLLKNCALLFLGPKVGLKNRERHLGTYLKVESASSSFPPNFSLA